MRIYTHGEEKTKGDVEFRRGRRRRVRQGRGEDEVKTQQYVDW